MFWVGLRLAGLRRLHAWAHRQGRMAPGGTTLEMADVKALGRLVNIAARYPPLPRACLTRSLLLVWLLRRHGVDAQVRIGVRLVRGALDAHAWAEWQGEPVNDKRDIGEEFASMGELVPLEAFHAP